MLILLLITLALWASGFLLAGRLRPCAGKTCPHLHNQPGFKEFPDVIVKRIRLASDLRAKFAYGGRTLLAKHSHDLHSCGG